MARHYVGHVSLSSFSFHIHEIWNTKSKNTSTKYEWNKYKIWITQVQIHVSLSSFSFNIHEIWNTISRLFFCYKFHITQIRNTVVRTFISISWLLTLIFSGHLDKRKTSRYRVSFGEIKLCGDIRRKSRGARKSELSCSGEIFREIGRKSGGDLRKSGGVRKSSSKSEIWRNPHRRQMGRRRQRCHRIMHNLTPRYIHINISLSP